MNSSDSTSLRLAQLSPHRFGVAVGTVGLVFYVGCLITMATVPHDKAVLFFNSLLHGLDVGPILRSSVPLLEALLGVISTFILGWIAGVIIAGVYNCCMKFGR